MCSVLLPPGVNPIEVNKYININILQLIQLSHRRNFQRSKEAGDEGKPNEVQR